MVGYWSQDLHVLFAMGTASLRLPLPENCGLLLLLLKLLLLLLLLLLLRTHRRSRPHACHPQRPAALCGDLSPPAMQHNTTQTCTHKASVH
jgi:hypothetical protein